MSGKIWKLLMIFVLLSFFATGCCYFGAKKEIKSAEQLVSQLKREGGPTLVPYEYCKAETFLGNAKMEADQGDWKHAKGFASQAKSAAEAGLTEVKKKK
jgi:hypothetical protein